MKPKNRYCPECHNTGKCHRCQGDGCVDCSYIGDCQECGHDAEYYEELEAEQKPEDDLWSWADMDFDARRGA